MKKSLFKISIFALAAMMFCNNLSAKQIGTSPSAEPISKARIDAIKTSKKLLWEAYFNKSNQNAKLQINTLINEMKNLSVYPPLPPVAKGQTDTMPLDKPNEWYKAPEAILVADNIISYQTPIGGWGKNQPRNQAPRMLGQSYVISDIDLKGTPEEIVPRLIHYMGTFDNDATITELRFLAKIINNNKDNKKYIDSFNKGLNYIFMAQYPNGGFPQNYPLEGGYHDAITYNDDAMIAIMEFFVKLNTDIEYNFVGQDIKLKSIIVLGRALDCILKSQVVINGQKTIWGQQHDPITLLPTPARNFEPISLSSSESASILLYLMKIKTPNQEIKSAINGGIAWLRTHSIKDKSWEKNGEDGRRLVDKPNAPLLWARYYSIETQTPIFGERNKEIFDDINDVGLERRNGYNWFNTSSIKAIKYYDEVWSKSN